jgi:hypothetical protein
MQALVISNMSLVHKPLCRYSATMLSDRFRCTLVDSAQMSSSPWSTLALTMRTSSTGLSSAATFTRPILCTEEKTSSQYSVSGILGCVLQPRTDLHSALDSSKDSVFPIQPGGRRKCDEELTACRAKIEFSQLFQTSCSLVPFGHVPFVLGPLLAMLKIPAPVCFKSERISSSNFSP